MNFSTVQTRPRACGLFMLIFLLAACIFMESCAQVERKPLSILDSSKHHTYTGIVMMNQGKLDDASREFDLARELNQQEVKSFAGTALIKAYQGDFESAFEYGQSRPVCRKKGRQAVCSYRQNTTLYNEPLEKELDFRSQKRV
ncbi:MAG: hypothetical protein M0P57_11925 [Syntrophales bacterium]|nr:hypothetical protein [Syntrophales bacterium]